MGEVCGAELGVSSYEEKMNPERDMGPQPIAKIMAENGFKAADLVDNSTKPFPATTFGGSGSGQATEQLIY